MGVLRWVLRIIIPMVVLYTTTVVIFVVTLAIVDRGAVPLGGSLLAAVIIALLHGLVPSRQMVRKQF
jgi:hypothetical protein